MRPSGWTLSNLPGDMIRRFGNTTGYQTEERPCEDTIRSHLQDRARRSCLDPDLELPGTRHGRK